MSPANGILRRREVLSWSAYDWANSAFATTVMAGFFPVFFNDFWSAGADGAVTTFRLAMANVIASVIVAILAPVLGAIADRGGMRKKFLFGFAMLGIVMTGSLFLVEMGAWQFAAAIFAMAFVGFAGGNVFYDSLLVDIAPNEDFDLVSGFGFALGYLGGGLLFLVNVLMTLNPGWFGLADTATAVRVSFLSVAIWWAVFSIPLLLFVREKPVADHVRRGNSVVEGFRQLADTFRHVRAYRVLFLFLVAYWLYIDGVHTVIKMAVDYGIKLELDRQHLITALLVTQFVGFPAAIAFGWSGKKIGPKTGIIIGVAVYMVVTAWASLFLDEVWEFYALAIVIGMVQGGVQSLSRSLFARLIPEDKSAEFFGFYNMLGKFAAVVGPFLIGWVALTTGNPRIAIAAIIPLFVLGMIVLFFVDVEKGETQANRMVGA